MASETEHWGQKQIRRAADFCRGRIPTVCANIYTATDFCPASNSRLQRRQHKFSQRTPFLRHGLRPRKYTALPPGRSQVRRRIPPLHFSGLVWKNQVGL